MNTLKGKINKKEIDHIPFGPFKIRIPFIHYRFEWPDYFQGLLMCAVDLAAIPLIMELLGMPFEAAMAIVILNGILYLTHHLLGDPSVPGWITPAIPLIMIYVQDFDMGPDRVKALMAFQLMLGTLSIFLGVTKLAKKVVSLIPSSIKSGIIIGAGIIAINIAKILEINEPDAEVTIIENNKEKAEKAAIQLEKTNVLLGDAVESDIMIEADIANADIVFSVTNSDEINTLVSILSKKLGAKNCYALLNEDKYQPVIPNLDIDGIISPRELTVSRVLKYIRKALVSDVHEIKDGSAEIIEFQIKEGSSLLGTEIKYSKLPENTYIGAVVRQEKVIGVNGNTILESGDRVIMCLLHDAIQKVEDFLSEDKELI